MVRIDLSLIVPLYNESSNVPFTIIPLIKMLDKSGIAYELILVNNGSNDKTGELIDKLAGEYKCVKAVDIPVNLGYGGGIVRGMNDAEGEFVGYIDGDGQVELGEVIKVFLAIKDGKFDMVKVSRTIRYDGLVRKINSIIYNFLMKIIFGINSKDINGKPKIFRKELLNKFRIESRDWFIDPEIMIKSSLLKLNILEVPIHFFMRKKGRSRVKLIASDSEFLKNIWLYKFSNKLYRWKQEIQ